MTKRLHVELIGAAIGRKHGVTHGRILDLVSSASTSDIVLDERAISRIVNGKGNPHNRTRLQIIPVAAELLGLPREAIAREIFWRDCYDRLSAELGQRGTPLMLEGFLELLRNMPDGADASSAWNYAIAPFMEADLSWDAMEHAMACLGGQTRQEVRRMCVVKFKMAEDRMATFASKVRAGGYALVPASKALLAARADSMRAAASEQLFSLALLNEENGWKLACDEKGSLVTVEWAAAFLPTERKVAEFSAVMRDFLPGAGWQRRISNNEAVLKLAVVAAEACKLTHDRYSSRLDHLRAVAADAVDELRRPCDGERVDLKSLPSYRALVGAGIVASLNPLPLSPVIRVAAKTARNTVAAILLAVLACAGFEAAVAVGSDGGTKGALADKVPTEVAPTRMAGPGGTKPTVVAAIGPGGTVVMQMEV